MGSPSFSDGYLTDGAAGGPVLPPAAPFPKENKPMKFTWILFLRILQAILEILMNLPDDVDPRQVCRDLNCEIEETINHSPSRPA